jgi:hypothetical protein
MTILPYQHNPRTQGLLYLLDYSLKNRSHSARWIPAILILLARGEVAHG